MSAEECPECLVSAAGWKILRGDMMSLPHRYSSTTFSKVAVKNRAYGWVAFISLLVALCVLTLYILQTMGIIG
jgi:hypothetical protein